jgi:catechol 2,3-dioxygenase-like lactoylglutathione lyase family enzyme
VTVQRMDNVGIVVGDLAAAIEFFDTLARLGKLDASVVDEVVNYQDTYRLCHTGVPRGF